MFVRRRAATEKSQRHVAQRGDLVLRPGRNGDRVAGADFDRGAAIAVKTLDGRIAGRGLSAYSSSDARLIMGRKSRDIENILGYRGRDEMIHRNDLVTELSAAGAPEE